MRIGILGTGIVGRTLATTLAANGHDVKMGSRAKGGDKAVAWVKQAGKNASEGTFADTAAHGEIVFNCTGGRVSLEALAMAGRDNLKGKASSTSPIRWIFPRECRRRSPSATRIHWASRSSATSPRPKW